MVANHVIGQTHFKLSFSLLVKERASNQMTINREFHLEVIKVNIWLPQVVDETNVGVNFIIGRYVDAIVEPVKSEKDVDVDGEVAVLDPVDVDQEEGVADLEGSSADVELGHVHRIVGIRKTNLQQV